MHFEFTNFTFALGALSHCHWSVSGLLGADPAHLSSLQKHNRVQESVLTQANSRNQGSPHSEWQGSCRKQVWVNYQDLPLAFRTGRAPDREKRGQGLMETFEISFLCTLLVYKSSQIFHLFVFSWPFYLQAVARNQAQGSVKRGMSTAQNRLRCTGRESVDKQSPPLSVSGRGALDWAQPDAPKITAGEGPSPSFLLTGLPGKQPCHMGGGGG